MKAMKKKTVSKIAKGKFSKVLVLRGSKAKTQWPDGEGPGQEQARPGCEQEAQRLRQDQPLDRCHQEGHSPLRQGKGVLQGMNALGGDLRQMTDARAYVRHQLRLWGFLQPLSAGAPSSKQRDERCNFKNPVPP